MIPFWLIEVSTGRKKHLIQLIYCNDERVIPDLSLKFCTTRKRQLVQTFAGNEDEKLSRKIFDNICNIFYLYREDLDHHKYWITWSLTSVTYPFVLQSMESGMTKFVTERYVEQSSTLGLVLFRPLYLTNSAWVYNHQSNISKQPWNVCKG